MKRAISIFLAALMALSLVACGGKDEGVTTHKETFADGTSVEWKSADRALSEYLASGQTIWYLIDSDGALGRESNVDYVYVMEPDGTMVFADPDMNLGQLSQMSDEDIIALVQTAYVEDVTERLAGDTQGEESAAEEPAVDGGLAFDLALNGHLITDEETFNDWFLNGEPGTGAEWSAFTAAYDTFAQLHQSVESIYGAQWDLEHLVSRLDDNRNYEPYISDYAQSTGISESDLRNLLDQVGAAMDAVENTLNARAEEEAAIYAAALEKVLADIPTAQYKLSITTDATGNNTSFEVLAYQYPWEIDNGELQLRTDTWQLNYIYPILDEDGVTGNCGTVVYDSLYGGYNAGKSYDHYFYTRVSSNLHFQLDEAGTQGIPMDVDAESLFN